MSAKTSPETIKALILTGIHTALGITTGIYLNIYYNQLLTHEPPLPPQMIELFAHWPTIGIILITWNTLILISTITLLTKKTWTHTITVTLNSINIGLIIVVLLFLGYSATLNSLLLPIQIILTIITTLYLTYKKDWITET
ncbi:MAG: hypothetical protein ACTSQY_05495 [Candidatus Odinarchaeia archaeon]